MDSDIHSIYQRPKNPADFDAIRIKLASPEKIREWSYGEVKAPETISYRTFKPERDGLFCAKIFGPVKDWECLCGKYKRMKHRGVVCDKCGVEVIQSKVRRERMGHIELAIPVTHIWFLKSRPSIIGTLLDIGIRNLEKVLYFESYLVIDPGDTPLKEREVLTEDEYKKRTSELGCRFKAGMGSEAVRELLRNLELETLAAKLKADIRQTWSATTKAKIARRLRLVEAFRKSGNKPEWMITDAVPVLPPDLRPLVPLEGGRFATSDLNDLYRRVINRNNRLKRLMELKAPSVIIKNEKRQLQESVDALFDNGRRSRVLKTATKRPLKSLSDMIKGKEGRFRQNLLGKRVDYSGRSVIVVGPELKLHQCGLPKRMALELFKPFVFNKLEEKGFATTLKAAKRLVEKEHPEVWDALEEVIAEHPVLLNRAPTLHRLGIQAFDPVLVEGKAIKLHPLVCTAFNADFDGDQMAVHVPLSLEAQIEATLLMSPANNVLSPANGEPVVSPTQDIILGIYYLTKDNPEIQWNGMFFSDVEEVRSAYDAGIIDEHSKIKVRIDGELIDTTTGRVLLKEILPHDFPFSRVNRTIRRDDIQAIIKRLYLEFGNRDTVEFLNKLMNLGFEHATKLGVSICMDDLVIPVWRDSIVEDAQNEVGRVRKLPENDDCAWDNEAGSLSDGQKEAVIGVWRKASELIETEVKKEFERFEQTFNDVYMMIDSGARGNWAQVSQIAGIKGPVIASNGEDLPNIVTSNYREGLSPHRFFMSAPGAMKRLADVAVMAASAGYLTRKLVDVAQDIVISEHDCGTRDGILMEIPSIDDFYWKTPAERITGRFSAEEVRHPVTGEIILRPEMGITTEMAKAIVEAGICKVRVRSPITCHSSSGACSKCYGQDLSTGRIVEEGVAVGIIAAQSIGEPGTQVALNRRHPDRKSDGNSHMLARIAELFEGRKPRENTSVNLKQLLMESGLRVAQVALLNELRDIYRTNGLCVNDKHFEIMIRKMTEKVKIEDPGDTLFLRGELVHRQRFVEENEEVQFEGRRPAGGRHTILGVTKAALSSHSWISAASFQETTKVLIEAAIKGRIDELKGLKENIVIGRLIPCGTGMQKYRDTFVKGELSSRCPRHEEEPDESY